MSSPTQEVLERLEESWTVAERRVKPIEFTFKI